jgi:hypothetical protein
MIRVQALVCAAYAAAHCGGEPFGLEKRSVVAIESEVTLAFCMMSGLSINANIACDASLVLTKELGRPMVLPYTIKSAVLK